MYIETKCTEAQCLPYLLILHPTMMGHLFLYPTEIFKQCTVAFPKLKLSAHQNGSSFPYKHFQRNDRPTADKCAIYQYTHIHNLCSMYLHVCMYIYVVGRKWTKDIKKYLFYVNIIFPFQKCFYFPIWIVCPSLYRNNN